jgi:outer membrane protein assembly factor BamD (BamD/ComL family)
MSHKHHMMLRGNHGWGYMLQLICIAIALWVAVVADAVPTEAEKRAFNSATKALAGANWQEAEKWYAELIEKFPESEYVPQAIVGQAQALIEQKKFIRGIDLLNKHQVEAAKLPDQFLFWKAEAMFRSTNYAEAAVAFGKAAAYETFPRRLEAAVSEATAQSKLGEWGKAAALLKKPDGSFQLAARGNLDNEWAARGFLLLAEAQLQLRNYPDAESALQLIKGGQLPPEVNWQKQYLQCRAALGAARAAEALSSSTNLLSLAEGAGRADLIAESVEFRGGVLELLGQTNDAVATFTRNLTNAPAERQREAIAKIVQMTSAQNRPEFAVQLLEQYLILSTNAPATNSAVPDALLSLGELHLKQHVDALDELPENGRASVRPKNTNHLFQALANFDRLIKSFPASPRVGKAQLDRGWCFWSEGKVAEGADAFRAAVGRLSGSEDLAIARFKLADAYFVQKDYTNALQHYRASLEVARSWPKLKDALSSQSLYQILRSSLELKNMPEATNAMRTILDSYPQSAVADRSVLLVAQGFSDLNDPANAQSCFQIFSSLYPTSELRPEVDLALARVAEQKLEWTNAIVRYDSWLGTYSSNRFRPQVEFYRAMASIHVGNETNAVTTLKNFVAQYPTNELAPLAQWSVAAFYYDAANYKDAEINFKKIFWELPPSSLALEARMMAGRSAFRNESYDEAIFHFTNLTSNPNCPSNLWIEATLARGCTVMRAKPGVTNRLDDYQQAKAIFSTIGQRYPDTEAAVLAKGEIAKCMFQLASQEPAYYFEAITNYQQVMESPRANISTRSGARIGLGLALENSAALKAGTEKIDLLEQARENYLAVVYLKNLREGETADAFWVGEAAQRAITLLTESFDDWQRAINLCRTLATSEELPMLQPVFQRKLALLQDRQAGKKN